MKQEDKKENNKDNLTKDIVQDVYSRNNGTEEYYKRAYCNSLIYTEGLRDFQMTLNAFWIIECVISSLPKITQITKAVDDGFFVVQISVDEKTNSGTIEIFREGFVEGEDNDHIIVEKQEIKGVDLPKYDYKFYLILVQYKPIQYTLLLPSEY